MIRPLVDLGPREVVVWCLSLDLPQVPLQRCMEVLSPPERERMNRFHLPQHQRRFGASQGLLRWVLSAHLNRPPSSLQFCRHPWGKPYLLEGGLNFNISHSRECLLVAISREMALGVDVEAIHSLHSMEAMARRCFAVSELAYWSDLTEEKRPEAFFRLWTLKEALTKATGRGLGMGVDRCVFTLDPMRLLALPEEYGKPEDWWLCELDVDGSFKASLCVQGRERVSVIQRSLSPQELFGPKTATGEGIEDGRGAPERPQGTWNDQ